MSKRLPIFTEKERADDRPLMRGEDLFAFYDRCPRRPFEVFRQLLNAWVAEMPNDAAAEVIARMRKGADLGFATGLCEVILHRALNRLGFPFEYIQNSQARPTGRISQFVGMGDGWPI